MDGKLLLVTNTPDLSPKNVVDRYRSRLCKNAHPDMIYTYCMWGVISMKRFVQAESRTQGLLLPEHLDDYIGTDNPVRVVDVFIEHLDLRKLGFTGVDPLATGRPAYHPAVLLKLYIYSYLNRIQSSRRLERETQRNLELIWLTGRLTPDFKTIANFRKDNGTAIRNGM